MKQAALRRYASDLGDIPHVGEVIAAIDLPKCVASSGTPEKIRHGLTCVGLYDQLAPHIFSATQVQARQARTGSVPVRSRTDGRIARSMCVERDLRSPRTAYRLRIIRQRREGRVPERRVNGVVCTS